MPHHVTEGPHCPPRLRQQRDQRASSRSTLASQVSGEVEDLDLIVALRTGVRRHGAKLDPGTPHHGSTDTGRAAYGSVVSTPLQLGMGLSAKEPLTS